MQIPHTYFQNGNTGMRSPIKLYLLSPDILEAVENNRVDLLSDISEEAIEVLRRLGLRAESLAIFSESGEEYAREWIYESLDVPQYELCTGILGLMEKRYKPSEYSYKSDCYKELKDDVCHSLVRLIVSDNGYPRGLEIESIGFLPKREEDTVSCFSRLYCWWNNLWTKEEKDEHVDDTHHCSIYEQPDTNQNQTNIEIKNLVEEIKSQLIVTNARLTDMEYDAAGLRRKVESIAGTPQRDPITSEARKLRKFSKTKETTEEKENNESSSEDE